MTTMRRALPWAVGVLVLGTACRTNDVPTTPAASKPLASVARERLALPYAGFRGFTHAGKGAGTFVVAPPSGNVVYNTIPTPYPGSFASMGFEATSAAEFGDRILLGGTDRILNTVVVSLDSWACENDFSGGPGTWTPNRFVPASRDPQHLRGGQFRPRSGGGGAARHPDDDGEHSVPALDRRALPERRE
jgi:hypothetical protein